MAIETENFSTSSYSGADIKVVATLNFASLERSFLTGRIEQQVGPLTSAERRKEIKYFRKENKELALPAESVKKLRGLAKELGTVQTISVQSHRPKAPVRSIGNTYVRGYTRGPRTIAGSMIFTVLKHHSLRDLCKEMEELIGLEGSTTMLPDQILPIDLTFLMANEYGSISRMALYGVEFLNSGNTMSIEDLLLEETVQFVCRDMDPLAHISDVSYTQTKKGLVTSERQTSGTDIFKRTWHSYSEWLDRVDLRRRF